MTKEYTLYQMLSVVAGFVSAWALFLNLLFYIPTPRTKPMAFKRKTDNTFKANVEVISYDTEGKEVVETVNLTLKQLPQSAIGDMESDMDIAKAALVSIDNNSVVDEEGEPLPQDEAKAVLLDDMFAVPAIAALFLKSRNRSVRAINKSR